MAIELNDRHTEDKEGLDLSLLDGYEDSSYQHDECASFIKDGVQIYIYKSNSGILEISVWDTDPENEVGGDMRSLEEALACIKHYLAEKESNQ